LRGFLRALQPLVFASVAVGRPRLIISEQQGHLAAALFSYAKHTVRHVVAAPTVPRCCSIPKIFAILRWWDWLPSAWVYP